MRRCLHASASAFALTLALVACGGGTKPTPAVNVPSASAGARGTGVSPGTSPPPPGLPPMANMPPPGVAGSKKAKRKNDAALVSCTGGYRAPAKDVAAEVKRVGDACAGASRMHAVGGTLRGAQADKEAHQEHTLRFDANKCYRVYLATTAGIKDAVVLLRDSAGDMVAESSGAALPEDGAICFAAADEITLMIAVGAGKGEYAAQVWSE